MKQLKIILLSAGMLDLYSSSFSQGKWEQVTDYSGQERTNAVAFGIGGFGYVGTGDKLLEGARKDFWKYDPVDDIWTQIADFGGGIRSGAIGFSIGDKGYVGTGDPNLTDFWEYDPVTNAWTEKKKFPGKTRRYGCGFSIGGKGYMGLGEGTNNFYQRKKDWYEYDPATNQWTQKADFHIGISKVAAFSIGNKGYVCCGYNSSIYENQLWSYDPATDQWTQKADFAGGNRRGPAGFAINGKGYVGTGVNIDLDSLYSDLWEYDTTSNSWTQMAGFEGPGRWEGIGFSINNKGYIGIGDSVGNYTGLLKDFYEFTPGCEAPTGLTVTNIKSTSVKVNWIAVSGAQTYSIRYRKTGTNPWTKITALSNYKKITGLVPNTEYDWSVKSVCDAAANTSSDWSAIQNFTTKPLKLEDGNDSDEISFVVFPNPFSSSTNISLSLRENSQTTIELFDLANRKINTVLDEDLNAGDHQVTMNAGKLSAGIYLLRLHANERTSVIKVIIQ
ncbi:MAG: fibronectin type III domain-containing protein [Bacteroidetes bacterium]|nr:fibronectin type III domain-containing protein [Bacteroidota bacterium]